MKGTLKGSMKKQSTNELGRLRDEHIQKLFAFSPSIPHLAAAKMLVKNHPDLFRSVEVARSALRLRTGNMGAANRVTCNAYAARQPFTGEAMPIPTPFWDQTPFVFDTEACLIVADNHIPFHAEGAIELAVKYSQKNGVKDVLILGDFLDHYQESDFCRYPDVSTLTQELKDGRQSLQWIRKQFPKGRIIYKKGNHEARWEIKVHKCLPEAGCLLDSFTDERLELEDLGVEPVNDKRRIDLGYLTAIHGHELGGGFFNPVNFARTLQLKAKECTLGAHFHQPAQQRVRTIRQNHIGCWSIGCLCNLSPHYRPFNDWNLGFAVYKRTDSAGNFVVDNKTIIQGQVV